MRTVFAMSPLLGAWSFDAEGDCAFYSGNGNRYLSVA